jgi:hypothetical protein
MRRVLKGFMMSGMPLAVRRRLRLRKRAAGSSDHRDPAFVTANRQLVFETYWKDVEAGRGPALIVWLDYRKILKFDCFGKERGHYHVALPAWARRSVEFDRIFLPEDTVEAQIERVVFELRQNLRYYLLHCPYRGARRAIISDEDLLPAIEQVHALMHQHRIAASVNR